MTGEWDAVAAELAGRYRLERELGRGGMATVYLARDLRHDRLVAIKVLDPELAAAVGTERFLAEIRTTAALQHPNILPLFDSGKAEGQRSKAEANSPSTFGVQPSTLVYYVMPYVQGESLRQRLDREKQLPVGEAVRIATQVAAALQCAHEHGLVHRDVKPENILLSGGDAILADFGIARAIDTAPAQRLTAAGLAIGTPAYMSPEQALGESDLTPRSDLYSLGAVLYEMLSGTPPFTGPSAQAIAHRRLSVPIPSLRIVRETVPAGLEAVILEALARAPADRPATARDFVRRLEAATSPAASPPALASRTPRRVAVAAIAALTVVLALAAAWILRGPRGPAAAPAASAPPDSLSLAVMYLENLSPDTLESYLADGLTEEITTRLARIARLRVKSRNAVRRARDAGVADPAELSRRMGVAHVVEGSIRRVGRRLRVSIRLVNASGFQTWERKFDVSPTNLLPLQDSIAQEVAVAVGGQLTSSEHEALVEQATYDPEAYDHYLRANFALGRRTPPAVREAIDQYAAALATDPDFVAARARQAYAYAVHLDWGWPHPSLSPEALLARGIAAADTALRRDSTSADAWMARAYLRVLEHPRTMQGATEAFRRAVALDPGNPEAYYQLGQTEMAAGRVAEAAAAYRRAIRLDPGWAAPLMSSGGLRIYLRQYGEAIQWLDSAIAVDSTSSYSYAVRSMARAALGRTAEARADAARSLETASGYRVPAYSVLAITAAQAGDSAAGRRWLAEAVRDLQGQPSASDANFIAQAMLELGDRDGALDLIERVSPRSAWLWFYLQKAAFDPIRTDPRFRRVMADSRPPRAERSPAEGG